MFEKTSKTIPLQIILGIAVGILAGYIWPGLFRETAFIGTLFLNALKFLVVPLLLISVMAGVTALGDLRKVGRTGWTTLIYFAATSAIAALIGLVLVLVIGPGTGADLSAAVRDFTPPMDSWTEALFGFLSAWIPADFASALSSSHLLSLALFALAAGGILAGLGAKTRSVVTILKQAGDVVTRLVRMAIVAAPFGVCWLVGTNVARSVESTEKMVPAVGWLLLTLVIGLVIHMGVLVFLLKWRGQQAPVQILGDCAPALLTAFGSGSKVATLPVTFENVTETSQIDMRASSVVLPLGAVANLNGTALFLSVGTIFLAQAAGLSLSFVQYALIFVTSVLVSIGAAGIPGASLLMLSAVAVIADLPPQVFVGMGALMVVDWLATRLCAVVDVWGDVVGAAVVSQSFELKLARANRRERGPEGPNRPFSSERGRGGRPDRSERGRDRDRDSRRGPERRSDDRRGPDNRGERRGGQQGPAAAASEQSRFTRKQDSPFEIVSGKEPVLAQLETGVKPQRPDSGPERPPSRTGREQQARTGQSQRPPRDRDGGRPQRGGDDNRSRDSRREPGPDRRPRPDRDSRETGQQRGRTAPDPAQKAAAEESVPDGAGKARISPEIVARELARVSAQLATGPERDRDANVGEPETESTAVRPVPSVDRQTPDLGESESPWALTARGEEVEPETEPLEEAPDEGRGRPGASSYDDEEPVDEELPIPSAVGSAEELEEEEEDHAVQFGRSRQKRGSTLKKELSEGVAELSDPETTPPAQDGFSAEDASFGRSRRKRTR